MFATRQRPILAGLALCLALLLAACAPQTTPAEAPSAPGSAATQPAATATEEAPAPLPASPTAPAPLPTTAAEPAGETPLRPAPEPTATPAVGPGPIPRTPALPVVPIPVPTLAEGPVTGEVPKALLAAILQDAEARTGIDRAQITLLRTEYVVWPDGSLGCPQRGMMYTQALVPGYRVVLEAGGRELDYHTSDGSYFVLCKPYKP